MFFPFKSEYLNASNKHNPTTILAHSIQNILMKTHQTCILHNFMFLSPFLIILLSKRFNSQEITPNNWRLSIWFNIIKSVSVEFPSIGWKFWKIYRQLFVITLCILCMWKYYYEMKTKFQKVKSLIVNFMFFFILEVSASYTHNYIAFIIIFIKKRSLLFCLIINVDVLVHSIWYDFYMFMLILWEQHFHIALLICPKYRFSLPSYLCIFTRNIKGNIESSCHFVFCCSC